MGTEKTQKINSIHALRGVAIMMIVFIHCLGVFKNENLITNSYLFSAFNLIAFNFTTVFVLIGGFLFQHLAYKFDTKKYYVTKLKTIICPYIAVSVFFFFTFHFDKLSSLPWYSFTEPNILVTVAEMLLTGSQLLPLWFIPMVTLLYVISPLLHYWSQKNLIVASIICMFWVILFPKPDFRVPLLNFLHFGPVYLIGMMIRQNYEIVMKAIKNNLTLIVLFFLVWLSIAFIHRYTENTYFEKFYMDTLEKIILFLLALYFLEGLNNKTEHGLVYKFCAYMADLSFPIFFIHQIVILEVVMLLKMSPYGSIIKTGNGNLAALGGVSILIITLIVSVFVANIIKFIFKDNAKYLIGASR